MTRRRRVGLSQHSVSYVGPNGTMRILDGVTGHEYELSREHFVALLASDAPELDARLPAELRASPRRRRQLARVGLVKAPANDSLLSAVELACHRQLNRGGFQPRPAGSERPHPPSRGPVVQLPRCPDFGPAMDVVECLARRSSQRVYADRAMPSTAFAALLELACRARAIVEQPGETVSQRAYPSGGARYSLEVYPIVYRVDGIAPGAYRYDPYAHALAPIVADAAGARDLLALVADSMWGAMRGTPSAVCVISSVFARTSRKYRFNAYHLILEELGALYQTLYIAAARLGLAACALGQVKERWSARWLGLDGVAEAQVGLFALGVPEAVQETLAVDRVDVRGDALRLASGPVAYTVPRAELACSTQPDGSVHATWTRRSVVFVIPAALVSARPSTSGAGRRRRYPR